MTSTSRDHVEDHWVCAAHNMLSTGGHRPKVTPSSQAKSSPAYDASSHHPAAFSSSSPFASPSGQRRVHVTDARKCEQEQQWMGDVRRIHPAWGWSSGQVPAGQGVGAAEQGKAKL